MADKKPTADSRQRTADPWFLYVAECADGTYYTGIAKDVLKRIEAHNEGKGAKYTRAHGPVKLLLREPQADYSAALKREYQVKQLPKARKKRFVAGEPLAAPRDEAKMSFQKPRRKKKGKKRRKSRKIGE